MALKIAVFPDQPQHIQTITWGDRQVRIRFTWRQRTASWYLDVFEPIDAVTAEGAGLFGDPIVMGRRISPRWLPLLGLAPEGLPLSTEVLPYVEGSIRGDPYVRSAFGGDALRLLLLLDDEIPTPAAAASASLTIKV